MRLSCIGRFSLISAKYPVFHVLLTAIEVPFLAANEDLSPRTAAS
jgi:hypothetical protein